MFGMSLVLNQGAACRHLLVPLLLHQSPKCCCCRPGQGGGVRCEPGCACVALWCFVRRFLEVRHVSGSGKLSTCHRGWVITGAEREHPWAALILCALFCLARLTHHPQSRDSPSRTAASTMQRLEKNLAFWPWASVWYW